MLLFPASAKSGLRIPLAIFVVLFSLCGMAVAAGKTDFETLSGIPLFAFGGIGIAGTTSEGERAFKSVSTSEDAEAKFLKILKSGTPQAQCYALVGLRQKNRAAFAEQVKPFTASKQPVKTCGGCIMGTLPMSSVVAAIQHGNYDTQSTVGNKGHLPPP